MASLIADTIGAPARSSGRPSGHDKRRVKNQLPSVFLLYVKRDKLIVGAALFEAAYKLDSSPHEVSWYVTAATQLTRAVTLVSSMYAYISTVFTLKAEAENVIRASEVTCGGYLSGHYPVQETSRFRCMECLAENVAALFAAGPGITTRVSTPASCALSAGVAVEFVRSLPPIAIEEVPANDATDDPPPPEDVPNPPLGGSTPHEVGQRLSHLYVVTEGATPHRYTVQALLSYLDLASYLKPSADVSNVLAASASIFFGADGRGLATSLLTKEFATPSIATMRVARVRLDLLSIAFDRQLFLRFENLHFDLADSSPQLGFNIFGVIQDTIRIPASTCMNLLLRLQTDLNEHWDTMICSLSSLGVGRSGSVKKTLNTVNLALMSVASWSDFDKKRCQHRGTTSDLGPESKICDMPVDIIPEKKGVYDARDPMAYLYPEAVSISDMLHIAWNGCELVCKKTDGYKDLLDVLTSIIDFSSDTGLMRKLRADCCNDDPAIQAQFKTKATVHIDWRWESMCKALDIVVPMYDPLQEQFDEKKLLASDSAKGILDTSKVTNCSKALKKMPDFKIVAEGYRSTGKVIAKYTGELEICDCHHHLWETKHSFKKRKRLMAAENVTCTCVWQGRRLAWFIAIGFDQWMHEIRNTTSTFLQTLLAEADPERRAKATALLSSQRTNLIDYYTGKCEYLFHAPHVMIGAYHSLQGGSDARSRELLIGLLHEVDAAIAAGKRARLHRIIVKLWVPGARVRLVAEEYLQSPNATLYDYPVLAVKLQEYALNAGVSRRIEKLHALIKQRGSRAYGVGVPYICACIREDTNLERLRKCDEFHQFCIENYHARGLLDRILKLRVDKDTLKAMNAKEKEESVYQCSLKSEYSDLSEQKAAHKYFLGRTADQRAPLPQLLDADRLVIDHLKEQFVVGEYFSIPKSLFDHALADQFSPTADANSDCVERVLHACVAENLDFRYTDDTVVFRVINNRPEDRHVVRTEFLDVSRACIKVSVLNATSRRPDEGKLILTQTTDPEQVIRTLDIRAFVENSHRVTRETFRWVKHSTVALPQARLLNVTQVDAALGQGSLLPAVIGEESQALALPQRSPLVDIATVTPQDRPGELHKAINAMANQGAFVGMTSKDFAETGLNIDSIRNLRAAGVVDAWCDDLGSLQVALKTEAISWHPGVGVTRPLAICMTCDRGIPPLRSTKLSLMVQLRQQGWIDGRPEGLVSRGAALEFRQLLREPLSYFAALVDRESIFAKGVAGFSHGKPDNYYRCLLKLEEGPLARMLGLCDDKNDTWFREQLQLCGIVEEPPAIEDPGNGGDLLPPEVFALHEDRPAPAPLLEVPWTGWVRKRCHAGDVEHAVKIYFDHGTGRSKTQQAWVTCLHHKDSGCIRWRTIYGTQLRFCAELFAWHHAPSILTRLSDKEKHMQYEPSSADIDLDAVEHDLVMEDF